MMQSLNNAVVETLIECGVDHVFGVPGGGALFLYDALYQHRDRITSVLARHEGAAACMADMHGRLTGKPAAVIAQGAWAASNAAFGILEAYLGGSPLIVITDTSDYSGLTLHGPWQNGTGEYGSFNLPNIMRSMTKYTSFANSPDEVLHGIRLAVKHSMTGRPGPVCVCARMNLFAAQVDTDTVNPRLYPAAGHLNTPLPCVDTESARSIADLLIRAKEPVIIAGAGIHRSRAYDELRELAELLGIPVATSFMGKSAIAETHDLALGTMGGIGQRIANEKIMGADTLFAVGTGLSPENTRMLSPDFINPSRQKIIQMDIEPLNVGWTYPVEIGAVSDAGTGLRKIIEAVSARKPVIDVRSRIEALKARKAETGFFSCAEFSSDESPVAPERIVCALNDAMDGDAMLCLDAGNNRQWFARHFMSKKAGQVFAPGGAGGVGWGPPAALAAQLMRRDAKVVCVCGDAGMMMMLHCLETAMQYTLPVTYVVLNNAALGNIRDFQAPDRRYCTEYPAPDFESYARAAGCGAYKVDRPGDLGDALKTALGSDVPSVVEVITKCEPHFKLMV
ncbi:MAG: thiamine pyrophosphate-binding protein [Spirochaetes bacterium]|nr:MAG: thiamine pyrophosphate-binding protein [Spirochaetota bacterium]